MGQAQTTVGAAKTSSCIRDRHKGRKSAKHLQIAATTTTTAAAAAGIAATAQKAQKRRITAGITIAEGKATAANISSCADQSNCKNRKIRGIW